MARGFGCARVRLCRALVIGAAAAGALDARPAKT